VVDRLRDLKSASGDSASLGDALVHHYMHHGLPPDGGEHESSFRVRIGRLTIRLPNPPARQRAVFFHDTNHILTGYDTTFSDGEMRIAGFELGTGCGPFWIAWLINLDMFAIGLVVCPRLMFRAFVRGRRASSVYQLREGRAALSAMPVGALKSMVRLDASDTMPTAGDRLLFMGWAVAGVLLLLLPVALIVAATRALR
jgi:hypothetical protein